jgi:ABC-type metal ion transport system substrate-binding protein
VKLVELDAAQLPRSLADVDAAVAVGVTNGDSILRERLSHLRPIIRHTVPPRPFA